MGHEASGRQNFQIWCCRRSPLEELPTPTSTKPVKVPDLAEFKADELLDVKAFEDFVALRGAQHDH